MLSLADAEPQHSCEVPGAHGPSRELTWQSSSPELVKASMAFSELLDIVEAGLRFPAFSTCRTDSFPQDTQRGQGNMIQGMRFQRRSGRR